MSSLRFTTPDAALLPLTVFYDHSCVLCRSEIENLSARDWQGNLVMTDCSGENFDSSRLPFDQATLLGSIHALDAKGEWLRATDVFVVCYRSAQMQGIAKVFAFAKPLLELVYPWIAKHRHFFATLGVHRLFNFFTNRHIKRRAALAQTNSMACNEATCKVTQV